MKQEHLLKSVQMHSKTLFQTNVGVQRWTVSFDFSEFMRIFRTPNSAVVFIQDLKLDD